MILLYQNEYVESNKNKTMHVSTDYKTDNQCFSNKCTNNISTYNPESNVERCNVLYTKTYSIFTSY